MARENGRRCVQDGEPRYQRHGAGACFRRRGLLGVLVLATMMLSGCEGDPAAPDEKLRLQDEAVLARYDTVKRKFQDGRLSVDEYRAELTRLRADELVVLDRARRYPFSDITIGHYFHRSRLKFPSPIAEELEQLSRSTAPDHPSRTK